MSRPSEGKRFHRVLVANRGEIAVRVLRGAKRAGYDTVAVYSDADAKAKHVREADRAVRLGASPPAESYLNVERILAAARASGADAIHPGYGFLSERAAFASAVTEAGLVFIGPPASAIDAMGDKSASKARMAVAGVPCIPGFHGRSPEEQLLEEARRIGFPLMIKAAAGGGGRGMRLVHEEASLAASLRAARSEAESAFGDGTLLLERALLAARHVEVQVFGDQHGTIVHFGERDCSIQRRNQKVVEESPSPAVSASLRAEMGAAAVRAARAVDYVGAGTVEFMLTESGEFFFLEMNTRLQVEHPVTELVYGVDLVDLQLGVAQGEPLPWTQSEIDARRHGHAIEVRLCAEDADFRPRTGNVLRWGEPSGPGVRVDTGVETGSVVSAFYDSMLGKIIVHGADREGARRRLAAALAETVVLGVETNRDLLRRVIDSEAFVSGHFDTGFFGQGHVAKAEAAPPSHSALAAMALQIDDAERLRSQSGLSSSLSGWLSCELAPETYLLSHADTVRTIRLARPAERSFTVTLPDGVAREVAAWPDGDGVVRYAADGVEGTLRYAREGDVIWLDAEGVCAAHRDVTYAPVVAEGGAASNVVAAQSDGRVVRVLVAVGEPVEKGQLLVVLESMKMEFELTSARSGVVKAVNVAAGDQVQAKRVLVELEPPTSAEAAPGGS